MKKLRKRKILLIKASTIYYSLQTNFRHREGPWVLWLVGIYFLFFVNQSWVISGTAGPGGLWQVLSRGCHGASIAEAAPEAVLVPSRAPLRRQEARQLRPPRPARARGRVPVTTSVRDAGNDRGQFPRLKSSQETKQDKGYGKWDVRSGIILLYCPKSYKYSDQTSMIQ